MDFLGYVSLGGKAGDLLVVNVLVVKSLFESSEHFRTSY